ncbi:MAG: permease-like cell division protein FtsX [Clostridia bacterium]|nr:permease-like cell division protein FtsX [Clostridia bacterium]
MRQRGSIRYLVSEGFRNIHANRLMSVASIAVLVACLVMIGSACMIFINVQSAVEQVGQQNVIMVFVDDAPEDADRESYIDTCEIAIKNIDNIDEIVFVSREEGFQTIVEELSENASVLSEADAAFLPDGFKVTVKNMNLFENTVAQIQELPQVIHVRQNSDLAVRLQNISEAITYISIAIILMLFLVALFIIANTIRITMHSRRLEISIMKAVGATNWFIRLPFIVEGVVIGIISACISILLLFGLYMLAGTALQNVFSIFNSEVVGFAVYAIPIFLGFLVVSVFTGSLGSVFSIGKYLKEQGGVVLDDEHE